MLALASSGSWGVADFLGGYKSRKLPLLSVLVISQMAGLALMTGLAVVRGQPPPGIEFAFYAAAAGIAGVIALAAFYRGMAVGTVSIVAPISATGAALPVLIGALRGERLSLLQGVGITLVLIGVALASRGQDENTAGGRRLAAGVGLALVAALGFGTIFVLLPIAGRDDVVWAALVMRLVSSIALVVVALIIRPRLAVGFGEAPALVVIGVLDVGANVLYTAAGSLGLISLAAVLASLYPIVTVALARVVLAERLVRLQQIGVGAALLGVGFIAIR